MMILRSEMGQVGQIYLLIPPPWSVLEHAENTAELVVSDDSSLRHTYTRIFALQSCRSSDFQRTACLTATKAVSPFLCRAGGMSDGCAIDTKSTGITHLGSMVSIGRRLVQAGYDLGHDVDMLQSGIAQSRYWYEY